MNIVGVGECMIELSQADAGLLRRSFAGDVFNTLYYIERTLREQGRSEHGCAFFSAVGDDPMSAEMRAFISGHGIDVSCLTTVAGRRPGLYMIHLDGAERRFSYWRDTSAAKQMMADREAARERLARADVLYFSGVTLAILPDADRAFFIELLKSMRDLGKVVAFDPNIRPTLWQDRETMRNAITKASAVSTIVLPSFDDERDAFGDQTPQATAARYISNGASMVIVKNGADAIWTLEHGGALNSYHTEIVDNAVDTTGAGDSFNGAFLANYLLSGDVGLSVRAGQRCAASVISVHGALVPSA